MNNYIRCSQSEERSSKIVFIFMHKDLFKKVKVEPVADIFLQQIDEFAKKKRRFELIYRYILITHYFLGFIIFYRNQ